GSGETWVLDLLEEGEHAFDGLGGPFCRGLGVRTAATVGHGQWYTQGHRLLIDDVGEARLARGLAQGTNDEAPAEERMGRISDFDLLDIRVLEVGIKEWLHLTGSATSGCWHTSPCPRPCSASGCKPGSWNSKSSLPPRKAYPRVALSLQYWRTQP